MTESDWLTTTDVLGLLLALRKRQKREGTDPERFRAFAVACLRRVEAFIPNDIRPAIGFLNRVVSATEEREVLLGAVERVRDVAVEALADYRSGDGDVHEVSGRFAELEAADAVWVATVSGAFGAARSASSRAAHIAGWAEIATNLPSDFAVRPTVVWSDRFPVSVAELAVQAELLRCVFGNPFRPVAFDPSWRTEAVVALARGMDEANDFAVLPVLADALEDAGCADAELLGHCRGPGPHACGCHVVDHVLGKW